ncbi:MAG: dienelactone hydrolase family protein [Burkholderia sp.]|nr:MAG: Carboxymethylenebutenolidase [Burkholderia gladioli]
MSSQWIDISTSQESFGSYLALPQGGKGPAVVIIQEIFGVNGHIRSIADQYATDGYVALAPDVFWRTQRRVELGYEGADYDQGIALLQKTDVHQAANDIAATVDALRTRPEVEGKVAGIGYCFGGRLAYLATSSGVFDATVVYYGGGIQNHLDVANHITQPIMFHYAGLDHGITPEHVEQVKAAFAGRSNAVVHLYPKADHGFNCNVRASYDQRAAALAHGRTLQFLAENL